MYMAHVCFYVCCDCVGVCGNVCCVEAVVKYCGFSIGVLKYVVCLCKGCDGCSVFVCILTRGAVCVHVWKYECFFHADDVCFVSCASCGSSQ